jgi:hypothetical protein
MFVLKTKTEKRKKGRHRKENEIQIWTAVTLSTFRVLFQYFWKKSLKILTR